MRSQSLVMTALCAIMLSSAGSFISQASADDLNRGYDWTVRVKTEEMQHYFEYNNSHLRPMNKISIDYYKADDELSAKPYEKMWYHDGKPLGIERSAKLSDALKSEGENIRLRVLHHDNKPTAGEYKAAANAILRFWLDAHLNKNQLAVVKVPNAQSLQAITNELRTAQNMTILSDAADAAAKTTMTLLIVSEADGSQMYLGYM